MAGITIEGIRKSFGTTTALEAVNLDVADREFVALLGPSGCGKTTLLRIIAGLETQTAGRVLIGGRDISALPPRARGLAMVFQNYAVFPHLTVRDNIAFGLKMHGADAARIARQVERTASLLRLELLLDRYPAQLSGGQRQRVAVARALAVEPAVLLMDEPLSNLDALLRLDMRAELKEILSEAGTTTLYVTHDQTEAMALADRIAVLHGGRVEQVGTPSEIYHWPATRFVGGFVGSPPMNFLPRDGAVLGIRPEDIDLVGPGEGIAFRVNVVEPLGAQTLLTGIAESHLLRVALNGEHRIAAGSDLHIRPRPDRIRWMDAATGRATTRTETSP
ncbi:MAG: ABC transporter ATP-binding protein [Alphaproteobacteria bacterium]|nr:ABC transporter ATP-binding protein [Alphaproteobacteria bacterium]